MLPRKIRLSDEKEIQDTIILKEREARRKQFYLVARESGLPYSRLAVVAPKKLGSAPKRNRAKRRVCEIFLALLPKISRSFDFVVFLRPPALSVEFGCLKEQLCCAINYVEIA